jgi:hypothetical protein
VEHRLEPPRPVERTPRPADVTMFQRGRPLLKRPRGVGEVARKHSAAGVDQPARATGVDLTPISAGPTSVAARLTGALRSA